MLSDKTTHSKTNLVIDLTNEELDPVIDITSDKEDTEVDIYKPSCSGLQKPPGKKVYL